MSHHLLAPRKLLRRPAGCEAHLTRRQAAALLGFASEYKIREFERQGLLRSVRGPMRTAFYARPDVLALKAHLAQIESSASDEWTDADLLALLAHPTVSGRPRTALELVTLARISIDRAEQVYAFWAKGAATGAGDTSEARQPIPVVSALPGSGAQHPPRRSEAGSGERRAEKRLARDSLIRELRDPDPRIRQLAFERLREARMG